MMKALETVRGREVQMWRLMITKKEAVVLSMMEDCCHRHDEWGHGSADQGVKMD